MRIMVVHNRYRSAMPSGENNVVDDEIAALRDRGHHVVALLPSSDEIATWSSATKVRRAFTPVRSAVADEQVAAMIDADAPDVVHVHNLYPLLSPSVIRAARSRGVPVVQTVHNHRHVCVKGTYYRDGHVCRDCLGSRLRLPAVAHACYRDSHAQSALMAVSLVANRPTFRLVDRFIALTDEVARHLQDYGVPEDRIVVKPNSVSDPGQTPDVPAGGFVYVGRLSEEKGVALLTEAWRRTPDGSLGTLVVVGDGPLRPLVDDLAERRSDVTVLGAVDSEGALDAIRAAGTTVIPSTCPDVFPRVAVESLAIGRSLVATALGGLPSIVHPSCGWVCEPTPESLSEALRTAAATRTAGHAAAARSRYEELYAPGVVLDQLEEIYRSVATSSVA